ncbi:MAG: cytochrome C biogenesis protein [Dehalococcoidia bacterium]|nr:cytochrome C biogenesis protein [Dehalococcoidia bacterium]
MAQTGFAARLANSRLWLAAGALLVLGLLLALVIGAGGDDTVGTGPLASATVLALAPAAFLSGLLSLLSPCTLPILPAYFAFSFQARRQHATVMSVAFFLGLATTITLLGASATALGGLLLQYLQQVTVIGGVVIIAFGVMSVLGKGFAGMQLQDRSSATVAGSYLFGATFALGWTTCIGPILGALLTLLAAQGLAIVQGAVLAFIYTLGLGMPLILLSTFLSRLGTSGGVWRVLRGWGYEVSLGRLALHLHSTSVVSGLLLIALGYLLASGQLTAFTEGAAGGDLSLLVLDLDERLRQLFGLL